MTPASKPSIKPSVSITITGHRINKTVLNKNEMFSDMLNTFSAAYAEALAEEAGLYISEMLGAGKWWKSRNPRFAKYRAWVKFRYGSDRARKAGGKFRSGVESSSLKDLDNDTDINTWGNVQHLAMKWLIKKLQHVSLPATFEEASGKRRRGSVITTVTSKGTQAIDVTGAIKHLERVAARNKTVSAEGSPNMTQREIRLKNLRELFDDEGTVRRELSKTGYGQRLLRMAEIQAVKEIRAREASKASTTKKGKPRKRMNAAGNFKWGVQTGQFRDDWLNATGKSAFDGKKLQITVQPDNAAQGINTWKLTQFLQAQIHKAGGNPKLLRGVAARNVMRRALNTARENCEMAGFEFRIKGGK